MQGLINEKKINKIKLSINTICNLSCSYCFVKKSNKKMSFPVAKKAINLLLNNAGKDKFLAIYGGEPFIDFKQLIKIIEYAKVLSFKKNKNLVISVCSNSTLIKKEHLFQFEKFDVKLIISMVGKRVYQDENRKFLNGRGTYSIIRKTIPLFSQFLPKENLGVSVCVFPSTIKYLFSNFAHLVNLGFTYFNFEIIREYEFWSNEKIKNFSREFKKIVNFVFKQICANNFIFINPINWELKYSLLSDNMKFICPFNYHLEVYPNGEVAFSPFLLNVKNKEIYVVGNLKNFTLKRFKVCRFENNSICKQCEFKYFKGYQGDNQAQVVYRIYHALCLKAAEEIKDGIPKRKFFNEYKNTIVRNLCF